jgi:excisionase family DNA binding protein
MYQPLLTAEETADRLNVSTKFIYSLANSGALPCIRLGKTKGIRFEASAVEDFLRQRTKGVNNKDGPTPDAGNDNGGGEV